MAMVPTSCDNDDLGKPDKHFTHSELAICGGTTIFRYPCMEWGCTIAEVKVYMEGYEVEEETESKLSYKGQYYENGTIYSFMNGKLHSASLRIQEDKLPVPHKTFDAARLQDYKYWYATVNGCYYVSKDHKTQLVSYFVPDEIFLSWSHNP